jgi:hypothetical protein
VRVGRLLSLCACVQAAIGPAKPPVRLRTRERREREREKASASERASLCGRYGGASHCGFAMLLETISSLSRKHALFACLLMHFLQLPVSRTLPLPSISR